jgi:crotonobetainyl-CoA:carnitine CoA-transferase CaiB-like acyl-CoA transferase
LRELLVVESAVGIAGPLVTRILADLGARVIKVESSLKPDISRHRPPPPGMTREQVAELFPQVHEMNAGKSSVTLNLKSAEGRELFLALLERADVYVENFAPGWLERLGLSHAAMRARNPGLVILSQSAYGGEGPLRDQRAYAPIMTALAGVESLIGYDDGPAVPQISSSNGDLVAAYYGALLALAALVERERTARGAVIDMSQIEASTCIGGVAMAELALTGRTPRPHGNRHPGGSPHGHYPVAGLDRWIALAVREDGEWQALADVLALPGRERERFSTHAARLAERRAVDAVVADLTAVQERDPLVRRLQAAGVACVPVLDVAEVDALPELVERPLWAALEHPRAGELRVTRIPWRFARLRVAPRHTAERMGESTDSVLRGLLGRSAGEIARMRAEGALD